MNLNENMQSIDRNPKNCENEFASEMMVSRYLLKFLIGMELFKRNQTSVMDGEIESYLELLLKKRISF